jgi:hypothetical protein
MAKRDMRTKEAERIRRRVVSLITGRLVHPRSNSEEDSTCLALFARMTELHKSICLLARRRLTRDAVVLGRTLCEAVISLYWLTNTDTGDRFDRYFKFGGKVFDELGKRFQKYLGYEVDLSDPVEIKMLADAKRIFKDRDYRWNDRSIWEMANEPDRFDSGPGVPSHLGPQNGMHYFWLSLHSHPTIWAIQSFLPTSGKPFRSSRPPSPFRDIPERGIVRLSTVWLFFMAYRIDKFLGLRRGKELGDIFNQIRASNRRTGWPTTKMRGS